MRLPKAIKDNLYFLLAETKSQVASLRVFLETGSPSVAHRILDRRGYTYNLKMRIYDSCNVTLQRAPKGDTDLYSLRAAETIASDLERLSDICHDCVRLIGALTHHNYLKNLPNVALLNKISSGIDMIETALNDDDTQLALKIGDIEGKLDQAYARLFALHIKQLCKTKQTEQTITSLFVAHRIEAMGDVMRDISESIISAKLGKPMRIDRFRSLDAALTDLGLIGAEVQTLTQTNSGSGVAAISLAHGDANGYAGIFKDGTKNKLNNERESVENWHEIFPGLAPRILSYNTHGKNASLLIEHLPGLTFEQALLQKNDKTLARALKCLTQTLNAVWSETKRSQGVPARHTQQLGKRLGDVIAIHPEFEAIGGEVCGAQIKSLEQLLDGAHKVEKANPAPFSVYIHGDFNLDNIIFDDDTRQIRFIDLHRSCYMDYVQDIAVFMVSNYRLQVLDQTTRCRICAIATEFHDFAAEFAAKNADPTFELRLGLGLARSFISSTRFILDKTLAKNMFLRGVYILERIQGVTPRTAQSFRLPIQELFA